MLDGLRKYSCGQGPVHTCKGGPAPSNATFGSDSGSGFEAETVAVGGSCIDELTMLLATVFMVQLVKSNAVGYLKERGAKKDPVRARRFGFVSAETRLVVGKRPKAKRLGLVTGG